jgi:hypothetical protein
MEDELMYFAKEGILEMKTSVDDVAHCCGDCLVIGKRNLGSERNGAQQK